MLSHFSAKPAGVSRDDDRDMYNNAMALMGALPPDPDLAERFIEHLLFLNNTRRVLLAAHDEQNVGGSSGGNVVSIKSA